MKLRNKKTGEIDDISISHSGNKIKGVVEHEDGVQCFFAYTLKEFNEEWEDIPEEQKFWFIDDEGGVGVADTEYEDYLDEKKSIGNYFKTKEEAEKAVEKLKAWKRLKDKGFRFIGVRGIGKVIDFDIPEPYDHVYFDEYVAGVDEKEFYNDLLLLFGGEE